MNNKFFFILVFVLTLTSCKSKKDILYFQNLQSINAEVKFEMPKIQVNDILNIRVTSEDVESSDLFNTMKMATGGGAMVANPEIIKLTGYLVNEKGEINFPVLNNIKVIDFTVVELENYLKDLLVQKDYLSNPSISVRVVNAKVSIMGEVRAPGMYTFTEQVITLPQALSMAGDLTINGMRKNITIIREQDGQRLVGTVDITDANMFDSPFYYIKQNDVIVVQPNGPKVMAAGYIGNIGTVLGVASFVLTMTLLLTR